MTDRAELVAMVWALRRVPGLPAAQGKTLGRLLPALAVATQAELRVHGDKLAWLLETVLRDLPVAGRG